MYLSFFVVTMRVAATIFSSGDSAKSPTAPSFSIMVSRESLKFQNVSSPSVLRVRRVLPSFVKPRRLQFPSPVFRVPIGFFSIQFHKRIESTFSVGRGHAPNTSVFPSGEKAAAEKDCICGSFCLRVPSSFQVFVSQSFRTTSVGALPSQPASTLPSGESATLLMPWPLSLVYSSQVATSQILRASSLNAASDF